MEGINLTGAQLWTLSQAQAKCDELNATLNGSRFLSYAPMQAPAGGYAVVLSSHNATPSAISV